MTYDLLIVDDSKAALFMVEKIVRVSGIPFNKILTAANGKEAIEVLEKNCADLILTDINMPEMDGFQLIEYLKNDKRYRGIPVLVITTEGREKYIKRAKQMGAEDYIKKPFVPEQVKQLILEALKIDGTDSQHGEDNDCDF